MDKILAVTLVSCYTSRQVLQGWQIKWLEWRNSFQNGFWCCFGHFSNTFKGLGAHPRRVGPLLLLFTSKWCWESWGCDFQPLVAVVTDQFDPLRSPVFGRCRLTRWLCCEDKTEASSWMKLPNGSFMENICIGAALAGLCAERVQPLWMVSFAWWPNFWLLVLECTFVYTLCIKLLVLSLTCSLCKIVFLNMMIVAHFFLFLSFFLIFPPLWLWISHFLI